MIRLTIVACACAALVCVAGLPLAGQEEQNTRGRHHAAEDPQPFQRGINSMQLLRDGDRWWFVTIFWDAERPGNPIPSKYLESAAPSG